MECPDCGREFKSKKCKGCGWEPPTPKEAKLTKPVPHCVRCGFPVPTANVLYTLCEACIAKELGEFSRSTRHPQGVSGVVADVAGALDGKPKRKPRPVKVYPPAVLAHAKNLEARGLSRDAALRLGESLIQDPLHRSECSTCQGSP